MAGRSMSSPRQLCAPSVRRYCVPIPVPQATSRTTLSFTNLLAKTYRASCSRNKGSETCPGTMRSPVKGRAGDLSALPRFVLPAASAGMVEQRAINMGSSETLTLYFPFHRVSQRIDERQNGFPVSVIKNVLPNGQTKHHQPNAGQTNHHLERILQRHLGA